MGESGLRRFGGRYDGESALHLANTRRRQRGQPRRLLLCPRIHGGVKDDLAPLQLERDPLGVDREGGSCDDHTGGAVRGS